MNEYASRVTSIYGGEKAYSDLNRHQTKLGVYANKFGKSMKAYTAINMTKWYCSRIGIKLVITTKNFFYLRYAS